MSRGHDEPPTAQPADVEDLVQDTLLRAYRAIDRFDGRHPRAWLLTIMRRAEISRHRRRRPALLDDPDADPDRLSAAGPGQTPAIDGLSCAEAAELLDVPEGTVMSRLRRARKRIRVRLAAARLVPGRGG